MRCIMPIIKYTLNKYWMGVGKKKKGKSNNNLFKYIWLS